MNLLSVKDLSKAGREKTLFQGVTFGLQENEKAALIGKNGSGKSTLLNVIAKNISMDFGEIVLNKEAKIAFLSQEVSFNPNDTISNHIFRSDSEKLCIIKKYEELCKELSLQENSNHIQKEFNEILSEMDKKNLWTYENQIASLLSSLKINDLNKKMGDLSGGMVKKVALAQVLVEDTKILFLDEPTNHLDIQTITFLQEYLTKTKRTVLMVTHDRYFLDSVCNKIYELERGQVKLYEGNYSKYLEKKEKEREILLNTEKKIESVLRYERQWLLRGPCARGTKIKARIQRDMELINREKFTEDKDFSFEVKSRRLGGKVLELHNVSKFYKKGYVKNDESANFVIKDFSYTFSKGQRIGIFGENGSGKTTLLNLITGKIPVDEGFIVKGENTHFGYYTQINSIKDSSETVIEYIKENAENFSVNGGKTEVSAAKFLEEFGFSGKIQHSPISALSGGEKKRLYLVKLLLENPNFLILDEITNDFDIFTMNLIEDFLLHYQGCLLIVSHDRYFMDKVADTLFILESDGSIKSFEGKCSEYLALKKEEDENSAEEKTATKVYESPKVKDSSKDTKSLKDTEVSKDKQNIEKKKKLSFKETKEFESLNENIPLLENELKALEKEMSSSDFEIVKKAGLRYKEIEDELQKKYERWENLSTYL